MDVDQKHVKTCSILSLITRSLLVIAVGLGLAACGGGGGSSPSSPGMNPSVAAKTSVIPPGAICANGGVLVETGIDENSNGILDASEVDASENVCNGEPGPSSLIDMNPEPVGVNCPNGGLRIDVGIDTNGNGSLDPAEITQTGFVCSGTDGSIGWGVATLVETDNTGNAFDSQVSVDANGNAVTVWYQSDGTRTNIWSNRYGVGTGWGTAQLIETDNTGSAISPRVSVNASGNAVAVWSQYDGTRSNIWSNRYVAGVGWGTAELIEIDNAGTADVSQVSVDASGNAVAVWEQSDGARYNIWSNRYLVGTGWGTAQLIESNNAGTASVPQVSVDTSGNAVAVWRQYDGTRYNIWSNLYLVGSGWGTAELIETDNAGDVGDAQVSVDASGNAVAVWRQYDGTRYNIWSNRYVAGVGWGTAELIETDNVGSAQFPQVSVDTSGTAVAVWNQYDGTRTNIWSNRYVAGAGWGTAELIETDNVGGALNPQVSVDASGNAVAVWRQYDGTRDNIWSNRWVAP